MHFPSISSTPCDIKVLILLYTAERRAYLGLIPNDQGAFVDRLKKVIQQQKSSQALSKSQGAPADSSLSMSNAPSGGSTQPTTQQLAMSQTNSIAMVGGQVTQNVVGSNTEVVQSMQNRLRLQVRRYAWMLTHTQLYRVCSHNNSQGWWVLPPCKHHSNYKWSVNTI